MKRHGVFVKKNVNVSIHEIDDTRTTSTGKRESIGSSTGVAIPF